MNSPRQLLVVESPAIAGFYQARLHAAGFDVVVAYDTQSALAAYRHQRPKIICLDPVLPGSDAADFIRAVRATDDVRAMPICLLPHSDNLLTEAMIKAGANRALSRTDRPLETLTAMSVAFCQMQPSGLRPSPVGTEHWIDAARTYLMEIRNGIHGAIRGANDTETWSILTRHSHVLTELLTLAEQPGLSQLAASAELLMMDLRAMPEQLNPSMGMTLGQTVDFLASCLDGVGQAQIPNPNGTRVLVVEDDDCARQMISASIQTAGLNLDVVETPKACLSAVEQSHYDLVFLDVGLPEMNGFELCSRVRSTPGHDAVPIVFLTGMTSFHNRAQSSLSGGNDFISKPFHPLELGLKALLWVNKGHLSRAA